MMSSIVARRVLVLVLLALTSVSQVISGKNETAVVVSVKDGDTFVAIVAGRTETIRLIGVDASESWYNDKAKRDAYESG
ncbi:MAG: thermonuclease, partial [Ignavibacteriae bacterium]|nr:thermonuclease [Ignavibacteriota bacterium]